MSSRRALEARHNPAAIPQAAGKCLLRRQLQSDLICPYRPRVVKLITPLLEGRYLHLLGHETLPSHIPIRCGCRNFSTANAEVLQ
jgi:hypothetical protein